jgi:hypothetical protein
VFFVAVICATVERPASQHHGLRGEAVCKNCVTWTNRKGLVTAQSATTVQSSDVAVETCTCVEL